MEVPKSVLENAFLDWKKKEINPEERSKLIKDYLQEQHISMREFAVRFNITYSTIQDWVSMRQYSITKKAQVKNNNHNTIYSLANRIIFLLTKYDDLDERTIKELRVLREKLEVLK